MSAMLSVMPVGLNDEAQKVLSVAMYILMAGGCGVTFAEQVSGETVVIVDIDSDEGRAFYEHDKARHRAVVIAGDECSYRADALIRKPVRVQELRNRLSELFENSDFAIGAADEEKMPHEVAQKVSGGLDNTSLFYVMVNAAALNAMYKIEAVNGAGAVLLHGPSRHLYTRLAPEQIAMLAGLKEEALRIVAIDEFTFMKESRGLRSYRYERFLWLAEAKGASGARAACSGSAFHLKEWPRFDIDMIKPEYLSLTAIMTRKTLSCSALARIAGVPQELVFDFYHAAKACGVVEEQAAANVSESMEPLQPKKGSLVSRIAKKLGLSLV